MQPDYEHVRERVERRLSPQWHLRQRQMRAVLYVVIFLALTILMYSPMAGVFRHKAADSVFPGAVYEEFISAELYPFAVALTVVAFSLIVLYVLTTIMASRHERRIREAVDQELTLEKDRLEVELARLRQGLPPSEDTSRHGVSLSDDGELSVDDLQFQAEVRKRIAN